MDKGMYIDIGGYTLFAKLLGNKQNNVTVVFDSGYGDDSTSWDPVLKEVLKFTKVFVYDRAGIGKSEKSNLPRTSQNMVKELNTLLISLNISPPYVLVGHSFGGVNVRLYTDEYPEDIAGLVLVDTTPADYRETFLPTMSNEFQETYRKQFVYESDYNEFMASLKQLKELKKELHLPMIVISAGRKQHYSKQSQKLWNDMQKQLSETSTKGEFVLASKSAHYIQNDQPEIVVQAIKRMCSKI
ncbi:alpha/beta hydrolase [Alkalihalobacillus sp. MEB130]|uniref:alpha/beta fold hydrolase n=1 Tax=Alkalihalobacillus sp. MEB130 TaxID=2976704 RepID=UPI0028DFC6AC|nr:alpha/beta hydrolase [Alkalihalobacillus sp. MEB130]MDT8861148.1 alpha/beta hydrolase [Alkalihalobacillus sp. MEB130]